MTTSINILDRAATVKAIASIKSRSTNLKSDVQVAVISALTHAGEHGDVTLLTSLVNALNVANATQLRKYIGEFAPVHWVKGKGYKKTKNGGAFRVGDAIGVNWDEFAPVPVKSSAPVYDRAAVIAKLQDAVEKAGGLAAEHADGELNSALATFYELLARLNEFKVADVA